MGLERRKFTASHRPPLVQRRSALKSDLVIDRPGRQTTRARKTDCNCGVGAAGGKRAGTSRETMPRKEPACTGQQEKLPARMLHSATSCVDSSHPTPQNTTRPNPTSHRFAPHSPCPTLPHHTIFHPCHSRHASLPHSRSTRPVQPHHTTPYSNRPS